MGTALTSRILSSPTLLLGLLQEQTTDTCLSKTLNPKHHMGIPGKHDKRAQKDAQRQTNRVREYAVLQNLTFFYHTKSFI